MSDTPETDVKRITDIDVHMRPAGNGRWTGDTNIEVVPADFARQLERARDQLKSDLWAEKTEHRMTKTTLSALAAERNQLRAALAQVAEDCTAWLHSENDEPSVEFIKAVRTYAHEQSQAPLDTANCELPTANSLT